MAVVLAEVSDDDKPRLLRGILTGARSRKGWSQAGLAVKARLALRSAHRDLPGTEMELALWSSIEVTSRHVNAFEDFHRSPLATDEKRARLLGITLALGLDPADVNRVAGGI